LRIAVACADWTKVTGHAGRAKRWLVYTVDPAGAVSAPDRVELPGDMVFHYFGDDRPHPLDGIAAVIAQSAGENFVAHMKRRGVDARLTAQADPAAAVSDYLAETLPPAKPRPVGALLCKALELLGPKRPSR